MRRDQCLKMSGTWETMEVEGSFRRRNETLWAALTVAHPGWAPRWRRTDFNKNVKICRRGPLGSRLSQNGHQRISTETSKSVGEVLWDPD